MFLLYNFEKVSKHIDNLNTQANVRVIRAACKLHILKPNYHRQSVQGLHLCSLLKAAHPALEFIMLLLDIRAKLTLVTLQANNAGARHHVAHKSYNNCGGSLAEALRHLPSTMAVMLHLCL